MGMLEKTWVFFDLDGTLTQSEEGIWNCVRYAADRMGFPRPEEKILRKFIGPPLIWSFRELMGMTEEQAWQAQQVYRERYNTLGKFENRVYPGVRFLLRTLRREGARMGIVSGKPEGASRSILEHFGLMKYFEAVSCATDGHAEKAELIRAVMPMAGETVWMIGDRRFDIEGGREAGVHTLGVTYGYGSREELETARRRLSGADPTIADGGEYDVVVVGAGPGGLGASIAAHSPRFPSRKSSV